MKWIILLGITFFSGSLLAQTYPNSHDPGNLVSPPVVEPGVKNAKSSEIKFSHGAARKAFGKRQKEGKKEFRKFHRELDQLKIEYHQRMIYQIRQYRKIEKRSRKYKFSNPVDTCYPPGKYRPRKKIFR